MTTPDEYCQQKAAASGSSFYYSFLFLPAERRRAITALYAYCREVDDVVDEVSDPAVAQAKLAWWEGEVGELFAGRPTHPVTRALQPHLEPFAITRERLLQILQGMRMDLEQTRYLDFAAVRIKRRDGTATLGGQEQEAVIEARAAGGRLLLTVFVGRRHPRDCAAAPPAVEAGFGTLRDA